MSAQDTLLDQIKRSNKLYLAGYAKGYEDGIKYACDKLEQVTKNWKPATDKWANNNKDPV